MKKIIISVALIVILVSVFQAHTLFLKLTNYFLKPNTKVSISLINGSFDKSENVITRDRMTDVTILAAENIKIHPHKSQWRDKGKVAILDFKTGSTGTYVIGVSTRSRILSLNAKEFNEYLRHDGLLDILAMRKRNKQLNQDASERYSKHVKAILQVGAIQTSNWATHLGHPVEIIPLQNPYMLTKNDVFKARIFKDNKPLANQLVYANYEGYHTHNTEGGHDELVKTRSDAKGFIQFKLSQKGRWYIRFINMVHSKGTKINYESNWATLTFAIR